MNSAKKGSRKRNTQGSVFGLGSLVWFSLGVLSCCLSSLVQAQDQPPSPQPPAVQAPETGTPANQQTADQQQAGRISGTVVDETGAVVVGARVTLSRTDQSLNQEVLSGGDGQFSFADVVPGAFQIRITAAGFVTQTSSGILHSGEAYIAPRNVLVPAVHTEVQVAGSQAEIAEEQIKVQEKQRVLGFVPNFYVSYIPDAVPLNPKQKFELAWRTTIDPVNFALTGAEAGIEQADGRLRGYGQGAQGYAKRFGASYADSVTGTFIGSAILPSLLKQDPRYFYKGTGSKKSRIWYAISNAVICKGDNQQWQPNYSGMLGDLASGGLSNLYYPKTDRGVALTFENALIRLGSTAVVNIVQEFIVRKFTPHAPKTDPDQP
ncbi:MAG TPA: carboxypeptidase-like regulatory domain-containing protein [Terriglobales bacterium]|nr:carboxypeptidase-like regulatory domain-containing protein [Terriglobales bacterium]